MQRTLRRGPWHILHFIGHGGFDVPRDEGLLLLSNEQGQAEPLYATQLARLLATQRASLRLVLLNSCEGARASQQDLLSSTAATLINSGIPAVLAMQYAITDGAAVQFARTFYEALADNLPVDAAVADARNAINLRDGLSLEWGTPVLHMRATDGVLFAVGEMLQRRDTEAQGQEEWQKVGGKATTEPPLESKPADPPVKIPATVRSAESQDVAPPVYPPTTIDFDWVTIPAGEFLMGSDKEQDPSATDNELPQHRLFLPEYRMARGPVTNAQYKQFVDATKHKLPGDWSKGQIPQNKENHPVVNITWHDALAFCVWAKVRLPSEAEWEKAARGPDGRIYPWGNQAPDENRCNFGGNVGHTTPVGNYLTGDSGYGCLDMAGNVWEWTRSKFIKYPYAANDGREDLASDSPRVLRGGSFFDFRLYVRCACRVRYSPVARVDHVGFRVVSPGS